MSTPRAASINAMDREMPDTFNAILTYKSGFIVDYCSFFSNRHYGYDEQFPGRKERWK
jgi:hypothetical protein